MFVSPTTVCHFDLFVSVSLFGPLGFCICSGQATGQTSGCGKLSKSMKSLGWLGHGGVGGLVGQFLPVSVPMGWGNCELLQCKQVSFLSSSVLVMVKMVSRGYQMYWWLIKGSVGRLLRITYPQRVILKRFCCAWFPGTWHFLPEHHGIHPRTPEKALA